MTTVVDNLTKAPYPLTVIAGCSGVGKDTLYKAMQAIEENPLLKTVSATTRPPRLGEQNGVDYHFLTTATFEAKVQAGDFIEHATFSGNAYGTLFSEVNTKLGQGSVCLVIELEGVRQLKEAWLAGKLATPRFKSIFVLPQELPSIQTVQQMTPQALIPLLEVLRERLNSRGTETPETLANRLKRASDELLTVWRDQHSPSLNNGQTHLMDAVFVNPNSDHVPLVDTAKALLASIHQLHQLS
ncbi:MAG: hypothetical protein ACKO34_05425 [Vampirovibrionales bacterium]